ncbi:MAG: NRDE family protein [Candidatus Binatia bacterium]
MCTLAIYVRAFSAYPLVVAANRDEFFARPTSPPTILDPTIGIFGGRDDVAGGTWLGVNRGGLVAALLNRRTSDPVDPARRSRGQLCLDMLRTDSAAAARASLDRENAAAYNPFNLLVADRRDAWIATNHGTSMTITVLGAGLHLITNLDLNDPTCPRIAASYQSFLGLLAEDAPLPPDCEFRQRLRQLLSAHDTELDPRSGGFGNSLCLHSVEYGTRSSTLIFLDLSGRWTYFHANDAPCRQEHHSLPVMELLSSR